MKKQLVSVLAAGVMAFSTTACGGGNTSATVATEQAKEKTDGAEAQDTASSASGSAIELAWNVPDPDGHPWTESAKEIAEEIEKRSNGSLKITVYPNNQLGVSEALDMMSTGSLAMDLTGFGAFASYYAPCEVFALPYAFDDADQAYAYFESDYAKEIIDKIDEASGIMTIEAWYFGDRNLTTKGVEVHTPEDLKGTPIRCMDSVGSKAVIEALGGTPVPMALSETYLSLQTGTVKGQENPLPTIVAQKFNEVQDHLVMTHHSVHLGTIHFSRMIWETLSEEQQEVITGVMKEYRPIVTERIEASQEENLKALSDSGMQVDEVDLDAFRANANQVIHATYGDDEEWMKVINGLEEFKASYTK